MLIIPEDPKQAHCILRSIEKALPKSRFRINQLMLKPQTRNRMAVYIMGVRLKRKKSYCGNHPGPCVINPFFVKKHPISSSMEGADWVGFNAMLNDILDKRSISADIYSQQIGRRRKFFIRKGRERRVRYTMSDSTPNLGIPHYEWDCGTEWDFIDCCGTKAPVTEFPDGTPGIPEWKQHKETKYEAVFNAVH